MPMTMPGSPRSPARNPVVVKMPVPIMLEKTSAVALTSVIWRSNGAVEVAMKFVESYVSAAAEAGARESLVQQGGGSGGNMGRNAPVNVPDIAANRIPTDPIGRFPRFPAHAGQTRRVADQLDYAANKVGVGTRDEAVDAGFNEIARPALVPHHGRHPASQRFLHRRTVSVGTGRINKQVHVGVGAGQIFAIEEAGELGAAEAAREIAAFEAVAHDEKAVVAWGGLFLQLDQQPHVLFRLQPAGEAEREG